MQAPTTFNTGNTDWFTPPEVVHAVHAVLGRIDLDVASCSDANQIVHAEKFYSVDDDGLDRNWFGRVYLNPPYARGIVKKFVDKLLTEYNAGHVQSAVVLVNAQPDAKWFKSLAQACTGAIFTQGRIRFVQPDGTPSKHTPTCGQAFFYLGDDPQKFFTAFEPFGYPAIFSTTYAPMNAHRNLFSHEEQLQLRVLAAQHAYWETRHMPCLSLEFKIAELVMQNYYNAKKNNAVDTGRKE